ncbi:CHC2 zinc finger domain-containing protein [Chitinophaga sp.]|uniref:CHC2 zinc finger domain-containing protein n=1 Tax=Chitinophaga sp. TaxID=1869181 RepID=UPI0031CF05CF
MEIKDIKQQLSIGQVLAHYGLQTDKHQRVLCPFHPDKTPSLQLHPKTGAYHCFSSNCSAGTGDVIKFIQLIEKCSTHEAIMKAKSLLGVGNTVSKIQVPETLPPLSNEADLLEREALMVKVFSYFKKALPVSKRAIQYLQSRSIDYGLHDMGYNSGGLHTESKNHHLVNSMVKYGLLKVNAVHGYSVWAKECVIFPLRNHENKIVSLYGSPNVKPIPKGWWGEWDSQHGEIEVYDKQGDHQGAYDPETGLEKPGKQRNDRHPSYRKVDPTAAPVISTVVPSTTSNPHYDNAFMQKMSTITGLTGSALIFYIIVSEGTRVFPPRNLVPIP